jgi:Ni,Fe-hydrogenase III component G
MTEEQTVQAELTARFPCLQGAVRIQRRRRIFVGVARSELEAVFDFVVRQMGFSMLSAITGLDEGDSFGVVYHLARETGVVLSLASHLSKAQPIVRTVTGYFPAADIYERELVDLLGLQVAGLPPGSRYPLSDDWPVGEHPLRKDWKRSSAPLPPEETRDV